RERSPAAADTAVARGLDRAQVFIERAAQVGEPLVVNRLENDFDGLQMSGTCGSRTTAPRSEWGSASVTVMSTNCPISRRGPGKLTMRLFSVRPASSAAFLLAGSGTSTRCRGASTQPVRE